MKKIKVYCLPYAGGSRSIFNDWVDEYKNIAEIVPLEYSGHGSRYGEELYTSADKMADDIYKCIVSQRPENYIIYGHSMGSLISLLTAIRLEKNYLHAPKAVIIGGTRPPHLSYKEECIANLPKDEFMQKIFDLEQTDPEIMNEPEFVDLFYDIIHADVVLGENYTGFSKLPQIKTNLYVMTGLQDDEAPVEDMEEWKNYCSGLFELKTFDSGHFFPFKYEGFHEYFAELIRSV